MKSFFRTSSKLFWNIAEAISSFELKSSAFHHTPLISYVPTSFSIMTIFLLELRANSANLTGISRVGSASRVAGSPKRVYCSVPGIHRLLLIRVMNLIFASVTILPIDGGGAAISRGPCLTSKGSRTNIVVNRSSSNSAFACPYVNLVAESDAIAPYLLCNNSSLRQWLPNS